MRAELEALYPFLAGRAQDRAQLERALVDSIAAKAAESRATNERLFAEHALLADDRGAARDGAP